MSRIGICFRKIVIPVGLTILFASNVLAKKKPAIAPTGRDIFMERCGVCHGEDGKGNGPAVGSLKIAPADLTVLSKNNGGVFPAERVKRVVGQEVDITAHGSREMPIWGDLFHAKTPADQQTANERFTSLVSYLESIQQ
jgi:mono/diheme cytochrome c family protein